MIIQMKRRKWAEPTPKQEACAFHNPWVRSAEYPVILVKHLIFSLLIKHCFA